MRASMLCVRVRVVRVRCNKRMCTLCTVLSAYACVCVSACVCVCVHVTYVVRSIIVCAFLRLLGEGEREGLLGALESPGASVDCAGAGAASAGGAGRGFTLSLLDLEAVIVIVVSSCSYKYLEYVLF